MIIDDTLKKLIKEVYEAGYRDGYNQYQNIIKEKIHDLFFAYDPHDWTFDNYLNEASYKFIKRWERNHKESGGE